MSNYFESEIEPIIGMDFDSKKQKKVRKIKMKCSSCGHIDYLLTCPKCSGGMYKYKNPF